MAITVDLDLTLKIGNLPLIFHPDDFAELEIRESWIAEDEKTAGNFEICLTSRKIRTSNIGKGWPNRMHEKISEQNHTLFEKENFGKILSKIFR